MAKKNSNNPSRLRPLRKRWSLRKRYIKSVRHFMRSAMKTYRHLQDMDAFLDSVKDAEVYPDNEQV